MIREEMKIGPKGQVVIPKAYRKHLKLAAGSRVVLELEEDRVILQPLRRDVVRDFEEIAKRLDHGHRIDPHESYNAEMAERERKIRRHHGGR